MNYEITLNEAKAYGFDLGYVAGEQTGKLQEIRSLISAGLLSLADLKASGRYTDEELAAIQSPKN